MPTNHANPPAARVLAVDVGASSGRVLAVSASDSLNVEELTRFETPWHSRGGFERWDLAGLCSRISEGMASAGEFDSLGIDTWGVDFALIDEEGSPIADPIRYRDASHGAGFTELQQRVSSETLFEHTGIQPLHFNTAAQLLARSLRNDEELRKAASFALMPDIIGSQLTNEKPKSELSDASTTQMLGLDGVWCSVALAAVGVSADFMPDVCRAGSIAGEIAGKPVFRVGSHDTASAFFGTSLKENAAFISSGTWSVIGIDSPSPIATPAALESGFSNERGVDGSYRFVKNSIGLWLLQRCQEGRNARDCIGLAENAQPFGARFDANHPSLLNPQNMPSAIRAIADKEISNENQLFRAVFENLAASYALIISQMETIVGKKFSSINIVGGGSQNPLLNQMAADACGIPVYSGPTEATALGNAFVQLRSLGIPIGATSMRPEGCFEPRKTEAWREWMGFR